jgi:hypothetical protein
MKPKIKPVFRRTIKPSDTFIELKLADSQRNSWEAIFHWLKVITLFASVIGALSLWHYTHRHGLPLPVALSTLGTVISVIGFLAIFATTIVGGLLVVPRLAQWGFFGSVYPRIYLKNGNGEALSWISQFGRFAFICFPAPLVMVALVLYPLTSDDSITTFVFMFFWVVVTTFAFRSKGTYTQLFCSLGALILLELYTFLLLLALGFRFAMPFKNIPEWVILACVMVVFVLTHALTAVRWNKSAVADDKPDMLAKNDKLKRISLALLIFAGVLALYFASVPPIGSYIAASCLRAIKAGGGIKTIYCFESSKYPILLEGVREGTSSCTKAIPFLLTIGDTVWVTLKENETEPIGFARAGVIAEKAAVALPNINK